MVAPWLVHLALDQMVWVQALARDIVLCSRVGWGKNAPSCFMQRQAMLLISNSKMSNFKIG